MTRNPVLPFSMVLGDSPWTITRPDLRLHPAHVESVTRLDSEFMITVSAEGGEMLNPDNGYMTEVTEVGATFTFRWLPTGRPAVDAYVSERMDALEDILFTWREKGTLLTVLSAVGRQVYLIESGSLDRWVGVPRSTGEQPFPIV